VRFRAAGPNWPQDVWIASIVVLVIEFVIETVAAAITKEIVNEAAGLTAVDFVIFVFLLPQFVIAVKRAHDRNISTWIVRRMACAPCHNGRARFLWLAADRLNLNVFSPANLLLFADGGNHQPGAAA
jgi:Protein of unknown function (DUF805)